MIVIFPDDMRLVGGGGRGFDVHSKKRPGFGCTKGEQRYPSNIHDFFKHCKHVQ